MASESCKLTQLSRSGSCPHVGRQSPKTPSLLSWWVCDISQSDFLRKEESTKPNSVQALPGSLPRSAAMGLFLLPNCQSQQIKMHTDQQGLNFRY